MTCCGARCAVCMHAGCVVRYIGVRLAGQFDCSAGGGRGIAVELLLALLWLT
jgi:hypothetical protein